MTTSNNTAAPHSREIIGDPVFVTSEQAGSSRTHVPRMRRSPPVLVAMSRVHAASGVTLGLIDRLIADYEEDVSALREQERPTPDLAFPIMHWGHAVGGEPGSKTCGRLAPVRLSLTTCS
ncbi:uncharacterized protein LOC117746036 isoform X3 [Cyclopterus lumpus]|uniref:uncharacterized protein LOC117746036 isoform X3 n=1 Tax=Cyclopterus lumpus TaxID=8103 RepID=UPI0014871B38|nr:uncharacterized protein LOC117746036 isoform X3 [Cyclopterus lumpus]